MAAEYKMISAGTPSDLAQQVTGALAKGWNLYGSPVSAQVAAGGFLLFQALTKPAPGEPSIGFLDYGQNG